MIANDLQVENDAESNNGFVVAPTNLDYEGIEYVGGATMKANFLELTATPAAGGPTASIQLGALESTMTDLGLVGMEAEVAGI